MSGKTLNNKRVQLLTILIFGCVLWACDKNRVFEKYEHLPETGWHKDSLINFSIPIIDSVQNQNLIVNVRNDISFQYSNLWLFIEISQPDGVARKDTFELSLADPSGKWLGDGFGGIKTRQVIYKRNVYFPTSGNYNVKIQHGMRENILTGLSDIGFRVEKVEK